MNHRPLRDRRPDAGPKKRSTGATWPQGHPLPLLEAIRRTEAEVKRRLAAEREAAEATIAEAERRADDRLIAAEAAGRRQGEVERQAARAEVEREASAIVVQARAEAEKLELMGQEHMETAVARAMQIVLGRCP